METNSNCGIYAITYENYVYIGQSVNIMRRFWDHRWRLNKRIHANAYLQNLYNKHKPDIEFIVLWNCDETLLDIHEQYLVDELSKAGFQVMNMGRCVTSPMKGRKMTDETRRKMSESHKGRRHSEETKVLLALKAKGRKPHANTIAAVKAANTGKPSSKKGKPGRKHTLEERQRQSDAQRGKKRKKSED